MKCRLTLQINYAVKSSVHLTFVIKHSFIIHLKLIKDNTSIKKTWSCGKSSLIKNSTKRGTTPACVTSSIGGLRSSKQNSAI